MRMTPSIVAFLGIVASISTAVGKQPVVVEGVLLQLNKSGTNAVEISVGNDDGVKIGDTLVVSRTNRRIGILKVATVERDRSTANIHQVEGGARLQAGDRVAIEHRALVGGVLLQLNDPGTNMVEISIGNDDGVKIGDTLIVSRKDRRIGMLKVSKIGRDRSAASIVEIEKGVDLQTGDQVAIQR